MDFLKNLFTKNTNYDPNDQNSMRYVPKADATYGGGLYASTLQNTFGAPKATKAKTTTPLYGSSRVDGTIGIGSAISSPTIKPQSYTAKTAPFTGGNINQVGTQGLDFDTVMQVLTDIESGGDWQANSDKNTGTHTANSALGRFQIVPKWWFGSIGLNPNSYADRQLFLNSQDLQIKALRNVAADYGKRSGGDPTKFGQMYFGGTNPNPNATDKFGRLTVTDYGKTFADKYNALTGGGTSLADKAAEAGLSIQEYQKILDDQSGLGTEDYNQILKGLGITDIENDLFKGVAPDLEALYTDAYNKSDLPTLKANVKEVQNKIKERQNALTSALREHNSNPFIGGATKNARIAQEKQLAAADIQNLIDERDGYLDIYDKGVTEIEGMLARVNNNFTTKREIKAEQLNYLLNKAEKLVDLKETDTKKKNYRYLPDYLDKKTKADSDRKEKDLQRDIQKELAKSGTGALGTTMLDLQQKNPEYIPFLQAIQLANQGASSKDAANRNLTLVTSALATGDTKGARQAITNAVTESLSGDQKTTAEKRAAAAGLLNDIKVKLDAYKAAGGNTNILSGNLQNVQQKLGTAGTPEAAALATEITVLLQNWRSSVTGAAWGTQEDAEYKRIMPDLTNTNKLNMTIIQSLQRAMDAQNRAIIASKIGDQNYQNIWGSGQTGNATATLDAMMGKTTTVKQPGAVQTVYRNIMDSLFN